MSTPAQPEPSAQTPAAAQLVLRVLRGIWRRLENIVFGIVLLLIVLYFLLQMPVVQNWLVGKTTAFLSDELNTRVELRHVDIGFFDKVILEGFYLQDLQGDTLLYAGKLAVALESNFFSLLSNRLEISYLSLSKARFHIRRPEGSQDNNLQFLLDYFSKPKDPDAPSKPLKLKMRARHILLEDVDFLQKDEVKGKMMRCNVPNASIRLNNLDLAAKIVDLRSVAIEGLLFDIEGYPSKPLPPRENTSAPSAESPQKDSMARPEPLRFRIGQLDLRKCRFELDKYHVSPAKETLPEVMDFNHLNVQDIDFQAENIEFTDRLNFSGVLKNLSAREQNCGFELRGSYAGKVLVNDTITALYNTRINTAESSLGDTVMLHYASYRDYLHFNSSVSLDIRLAEGSKLRLGDIAAFSNPLGKNRFFSGNRDEVAQISGLVFGKVGKKLRGEKLRINLGQRIRMEGDFRGDGLTGDVDQSIIELRLDRLESDIETIGKIMPGFRPPANFYRLGHIGFSGDYQIFFGFSHILHGKVLTDIGGGDVDLNLDLKNGREKATYSGYLNMRDFDLATWTGNPKFGSTTFNLKIADGSSGLTLPAIKARLDGTVESFSYNGYDYRNVAMNGSFREFVFDGKLGIKDPNIDFSFDGTVNLKDTVPQFLFQTDIRRLATKALNLTEQDLVISGKVDRIRLSASNWDNLVGTVMLRDFLIIQDKQYRHEVDSLQFSSQFRPDGSRYVSINSDIADGFLEGDFDFKKVHQNLINTFSRYYPEFAARLGLPPADSSRSEDNYNLHFRVRDTRNLTRLFSNQLDTLREIVVDGEMNTAEGLSWLDVDIPQLRFGSIFLQNTHLGWQGKKDEGTLLLTIPQSKLSGTKLAPISLNGQLSGQSLHFKLSARENQDTTRILKGVNIDGVLSTWDSLWQVKFNASDIALFNDYWVMNEENYVRFGKDQFITKDFELFNEDQRILLDSFNLGRGLSLSLTNFDLRFVNRFLNPKKLRCRGKIFDFDVKINDIFRLEGINTYVATDTIFINDVPYGDITGNFEMADTRAPLWWKTFVNYENQRLRVAGAWLPGGDSSRYVREVDLRVSPKEFQAQVDAERFPLSILQTFVPGISQTAGRFDANVRLGGPFSKVGMDGFVRIRSGQFQLDYLKTKYHIANQRIQLTNQRIWADGDTIWDDNTPRNMAVIRGGLSHNHFKNWRMDTCEVSSSSDNFLILNTNSKDNSLYYGRGAGKFRARFSGTFSRTNIQIDATTGKETRLYLPVTAAADAQEVKFIKLKPKAPPDEETPAVGSPPRGNIRELKGLNLEMNLSITDAAEVQLIFDEQAGDIIKGRGTGDIRLAITRAGEFLMYGNYVIKRGEYLFTLLNWINKPFTVREGGTINWYGDPYGAQISLDATYSENTPPFNFIRDEIQLLGGDDSDAARAAKKPTLTVVTMHLKGDLLKPAISFDLDFPIIINELKTLTDNKLRLLRQDQNELNRQVFGLVVVGSFLPSNSGFIQSSDYVTSAFNTLTQVLSNQFSNYLTGLASEWFGTSVSSIDFDIAYNEYQNALNNPGQTLNQTGRELQIRLTSGFANDRVTVQVGSQFGIGRPGTTVQNGFLGEDVTVEIQLTENRQWRLKVYQRTEPDIAGGQRRARYGFGLSFRKEYDSFGELMSGLGGWFKKK
jgi:hypothetical protein